MSCVHEHTWCVFVYKHKVHICGVCVNFRHLYNVTLSVELVALTTPLKHRCVVLKSLQRPWRCSLRCTVWRRARLRFGVCFCHAFHALLYSYAVSTHSVTFRLLCLCSVPYIIAELFLLRCALLWERKLISESFPDWWFLLYSMQKPVNPGVTVAMQSVRACRKPSGEHEEISLAMMQWCNGASMVSIKVKVPWRLLNVFITRDDIDCDETKM